MPLRRIVANTNARSHAQELSGQVNQPRTAAFQANAANRFRDIQDVRNLR
jgi:hypothetical protein